MKLLKIGGGKSINIAGIANDLSESQDQWLIIHGANTYRDDLLQQLGIAKKIITGVSGVQSVYSDQEMLDTMLMSYSGLRNKHIVSTLQAAGVNAIGLTGLDGKLIEARQNRGIRAVQNGKKVLVRDQSGKPQGVNQELLQLLISHDYTPVLTQPLLGQNGLMLNSENDDVVTLLTSEIEIDEVIMLIEAPGLLADSEKEETVYSTVDTEALEEIIRSSSSRIQRKLMAIQKILSTGCNQVILADGRVDHPLQDIEQGMGTRFRSIP